jgi:myo-inositol-1(or 4)-monophosphatase
MGEEAGAWRDDLELALHAVRAAGRVVMETFRTDPEVRHKGPDQPVTDADLAADALLAKLLGDGRPDYGWLSEESADRPDRLGRYRVWIVDPIDGTRSFIAGYREFAVSVALAEAGRPVVGVIYNPAANHVVWATSGGGASGARGWSGGTAGAERLDLERTGTVDTLLVSRSERARGEFEAFEGKWRIREVGSTAWKLAGVALGWGAYMSRGPKSEWDVAAGALIVAEAGGVVTDLEGRAMELNRRRPYVHGVVAGSREDHGRLLSRARTLPAPRLDRDA